MLVENQRISPKLYKIEIIFYITLGLRFNHLLFKALRHSTRCPLLVTVRLEYPGDYRACIASRTTNYRKRTKRPQAAFLAVCGRFTIASARRFAHRYTLPTNTSARSYIHVYTQAHVADILSRRATPVPVRHRQSPATSRAVLSPVASRRSRPQDFKYVGAVTKY